MARTGVRGMGQAGQGYLHYVPALWPCIQYSCWVFFLMCCAVLWCDRSRRCWRRPRWTATPTWCTATDTSNTSYVPHTKHRATCIQTIDGVSSFHPIADPHRDNLIFPLTWRHKGRREDTGRHWTFRGANGIRALEACGCCVCPYPVD